jgi:arginyl-tRNA synthetase
MDVEEMKKEISNYEKKEEELKVSLLDSIKPIIENCKKFIKEEYKRIVEKEVKSKPDITKDLGIEKLKELKKELNELIEKANEMIDKEFNKSNYWIHQTYSNEKAERELSSEYSIDKIIEKLLTHNLCVLLGYVGEMINRYGYINIDAYHEESLYYRVPYAEWKRENGRIIYGYGICFPDYLENSINDYSKQLKIWRDIICKLKELKNQLNKQEATDLWDQI